MLRKKVFFFSNCFIFIFWIILSLITFFIYKSIFVLNSPIKELHNVLTYGEFFIVATFSIIILLFLHYLINETKDKILDTVFGNKKDNNSSSNIIEDREAKSIKDDLLDREKIVSDLAKMIKVKHHETFTIAVDGNWGEGKSTIINFVKQKLSEDDNFIFFDFNPWFYSNEKSIIEGFFEELQKEHSFLSESKFLKKLVTENSEKLFKFKVPFRKSGSIQKLKGKISKKLIYRKQKLIIVIDDIDRLSKPEEILEVLKIIGIFQKLQNIIFLVAFDKDVVEANLKGIANKDKMYLEKLINFSFKIITKQNNIDKFFTKSIEREFTGKNKSINIKDIKRVYFEDISMPSYLSYDSNYKKTYWKFNTLREVKQFLNSFTNTHKILEQEVNIRDLFRLTIFKTFYLKIYNDILNNKDFYIGGTFSRGSQMKDNDKKFIKEYINELTKDSKNKDFMLGNIINLFPALNMVFDGHASTVDYESAEKESRICHQDYFHRYFLEEVTEDEVSNKFVINFIENWSSKPLDEKKDLYSPNNKKYKDFLRKIQLNIEKINKNDHDDFIRENCKELIEENDSSVDNYEEICNILLRLIDFENLTENKNYHKNELNKFIKIINQSSSLYFVNIFIDSYKNKSAHRQGYKKVIKGMESEFHKRIENELFVDKKDIIKETKNIINFTRLIGMNFKDPSLDKRIEEYLNMMFKKDLKYLIKLLELYFARKKITNGIGEFVKLIDAKNVMDFVNNNKNDINKLSQNDISIINKFTSEYKKYIKDKNK